MMLSPAPPPFSSSGFTPTLNSEYFFNEDPSVSSQSPLLLGQTYESAHNSPNQTVDSRPLQLNDQALHHPVHSYQTQYGRSVNDQNQRSQSDAGAYVGPVNGSILSMANPPVHPPINQSTNHSNAARPAVHVLTQPRPVRLAPPAVTQPSSPVMDHHSIDYSVHQPRHAVTQTAPSSPVLAPGHSITRPISGQDGPLEYVGPFVLGPVLGRGCTGTVRLGTHRTTGFEVAFKIIEKKYLNSEPKLWKKVKREIAILKLIEHPFVLRLYDVLETEHRLYLVLEHVKGGELFDYIVSKGRLDRHESLRLTAQIVQGLEHCHAHSICHRDLKPENLLLDETKNIKIADFGMAQLMKQNSILKTSCGSPHYASPEIIEGHNYDARVTDVWSIGVILYALITGSLPFDHDNIPTLLSMVTKGIYTTPAHVPSDVSHLISRMLTVDPQKRIKLAEIRSHPAFKNTTHFAPIRGDSWPFNIVKQPSADRKTISDPSKYRTITHSDIHNDISDASCDSSDDDDNNVDDNLIADLEALGISSSTNREELKAKVANKSGHSREDSNNIERRFYDLLKKRRHSRLSQLSVLSPKVSPRAAIMSNSYSIASSSSTFNGPFFHRAQSQPEADHLTEGAGVLPGHTSAPSSRNVSSTRHDTVTIALTPEMMAAGHWVERGTGFNTGESSDLRSEIPISPLELDDDGGSAHSPRYSSYPPPMSRLHSAPSPSRETDKRNARLTVISSIDETEESAADFYSRLASEPRSPRGMAIVDSIVSSAPSSPSSSYGMTSPISASAPQTSMMSVVSAQVKAQRSSQAMQQSSNQLEPPGSDRSHRTDDHHSVARRLFEGDGPEIRIDHAGYVDSQPHSTPLVNQSEHHQAHGHVFSTPRFHRVRVDPGLADQSASSSSHAAGPNLGSPVKKSSWFSSIFSGKTNLNLFARTNTRKSPKVPSPSDSQSTRSSKPVAGLYSTKTTLTIADEVRRALKNSGVHYSMKQAGLAGGSRFECKVGDEDKKSSASQAPEVRSWSRRFSTTTMDAAPRLANNHSVNQSANQSKPRPTAERRGSVGAVLWGTAPLFSTNNIQPTHQSFNSSSNVPSPARPPRHRSRPASPVITPPTHTRHSSYFNNQSNDHVISIASSGGRSRANSDDIDPNDDKSNSPSNAHVRFVVEITHTNDHRCVRFIHISGDEAQFRQWQQQISTQLHL